MITLPLVLNDSVGDTSVAEGAETYWTGMQVW